MEWGTFKQIITDFTVEKDALHVYAAVCTQFMAAYLLRRPISSVWPWIIVLGLSLVNEFLDVMLGDEPRVQAWQVAGAAHDLLNGMLLPTMLVVLVRAAPFLFATGEACTADVE